MGVVASCRLLNGLQMLSYHKDGLCRECWAAPASKHQIHKVAHQYEDKMLDVILTKMMFVCPADGHICSRHLLRENAGHDAMAMFCITNNEME